MADEPKIPKPPDYLSAEAKALWRKICFEYDILDSAGLTLVESVASSFDVWQKSQKQISKEGITTKDRWGALKAHPAIAIMRDAKSAMLRALRELHLDDEEMYEKPGRPPGRKGRTS